MPGPPPWQASGQCSTHPCLAPRECASAITAWTPSAAEWNQTSPVTPPAVTATSTKPPPLSRPGCCRWQTTRCVLGTQEMAANSSSSSSSASHQARRSKPAVACQRARHCPDHHHSLLANAPSQCLPPLKPPACSRTRAHTLLRASSNLLPILHLHTLSCLPGWATLQK